MARKVGRVIHYFDRIGVAVVELSGDLALGEKVQFVRGDKMLFEQDIESMQIEHQAIDSARRGEEVAIKVSRKVKRGTELYKVQKGFLRRLFGG